MSRSKRGPVPYRRRPLLKITRTPAELFVFLAADLAAHPEPQAPVLWNFWAVIRAMIDPAAAEPHAEKSADVLRLFLKEFKAQLRTGMKGEHRGEAVELFTLLQRFVEAFEQQLPLLPTAWYDADPETVTVDPDWAVRWMLSKGRGHEQADTFSVTDGDLHQVGLLHPPAQASLDWIVSVEQADQRWLGAWLDSQPGTAGPAHLVDIRDVITDVEEEPNVDWRSQKDVFLEATGWKGSTMWDALDALGKTEEHMLQPRPAGWRSGFRRGGSLLLAVPLRGQIELFRIYRLAAAIWVRLLAPAPPAWAGRDEPLPLKTVQALLRMPVDREPVALESWTETGEPTTPEQNDQIQRFMAAEAEGGTDSASRATPRLLDVAEAEADSPCWSAVASLILAHGFRPPRSLEGLIIMARGLLYAVQPSRPFATLSQEPEIGVMPYGALDLLSRQMASIINESDGLKKPLPRTCQRPLCGNYYVRQPPKEKGTNWSTHARGTRYCCKQCAAAARKARSREVRATEG